jgi:UDP-N-acetylglucosamine 2-epimerase (non-hydrolysing)
VKVLHIVGARPNFMKVAPVLNALKSYQHAVQTLVHTGQHHDANMSDVFFQQLGILAPDVNLAVGSGTHARQTADIMTRFEPLVLERKPDIVLVYGDVNSTVAAALVCAGEQGKEGNDPAPVGRAHRRTHRGSACRIGTGDIRGRFFEERSAK